MKKKKKKKHQATRLLTLERLAEILVTNRLITKEQPEMFVPIISYKGLRVKQ